MDSTASAKASFLDSSTSAMGFPFIVSAGVPTTSFQEGLTHRTIPSRPRSRTTFRDCSAAAFKSSRSSRMSILVVLSMGSLPPASSCRSAATVGARSDSSCISFVSPIAIASKLFLSDQRNPEGPLRRAATGRPMNTVDGRSYAILRYLRC